MKISDLFKPKWQHSDLQARLQAVEDMSTAEAETLCEIACRDEDATVRMAAVQKIHDEQHLEKIASSDPNKDVMNYVCRELNNIYKEVTINCNNASESEAYLSRISDDHVLCEIVLGAVCDAVKLKALVTIHDEDVLFELAKQNIGKEAGELIVQKINGEEHLNHLKTEGGNKTIRKYTAEKLKELNLDVPDDEDLRQDVLQELFDHVDSLKESWNFDAVSEIIDKEKDRWLKEDPAFEHELAKGFNEAINHFEKRRRNFADKQEREKERLGKEAELSSKKAAVTESIVNLNPSEAGFSLALDEYKAKWSELEQLPEEKEKRLLSEYNTAVNDCEQKNVVLADEKLRKENILKILEDCPAEIDSYELAKETLKKIEGLDLTTLYLSLETPKIKIDKLTEQAQVYIGKNESEQKTAEESLEKIAEQSIEQMTKYLAKEYLLKDQSKVKKMRQSWDKADPQHKHAGYKKFRKQLDEFYQRADVQREEQKWDEWHNKDIKAELIKRVEACAEIDDLGKVAKIIQTAQDDWKKCGQVSKAESDQMWKAFHKACDENYQRCKVFFDEQKNVRSENLIQAEELCVKAEAVKESEDWRTTAEYLKGLQQAWKDVGPLPKAQSKKCFDRFQAACNQFFNKRKEFFSEKDEERNGNLAEKHALIEKMKALLENSSSDTADCIAIQKEWKEIGPVPKRKSDQVWNDFQKQTQAFFDKIDEQRSAAVGEADEHLQRFMTLVNSDSISTDTETIKSAVSELNQHSALELPFKILDQHHSKLYHASKDLSEKIPEMENEQINELVQAFLDSNEWILSAKVLKTCRPKMSDKKAVDEWMNKRKENCDDRILDQFDNLFRKEEIIKRVKSVTQKLESYEGQSAEPTLSLAEQLQLAMTDSVAKEQKIGEDEEKEIHKLKDQWKKHQFLPKSEEKTVEAHFNSALDVFYSRFKELNNA
ncbi:MAG: DUF349 domain-containing protein [Lentisphaeria bacterium]|nr:DUF349 domain-containing protein [Lentisphaeria bacterium]NQZ66563.1 DUF349 domain-containing protein [Lentisphaeria bacterium]